MVTSGWLIGCLLWMEVQWRQPIPNITCAMDVAKINETKQVVYSLYHPFEMLVHARNSWPNLRMMTWHILPPSRCCCPKEAAGHPWWIGISSLSSSLFVACWWLPCVAAPAFQLAEVGDRNFAIIVDEIERWCFTDRLLDDILDNSITQFCEAIVRRESVFNFTSPSKNNAITMTKQ